MESITKIRLMMAEQKFYEVQLELEAQLLLQDQSQRYELLLIYLEALKAQDKSIPSSLTLELCDIELEKHNFEAVEVLLTNLSNQDQKQYFLKIQKMKLQIDEVKGRMNDLYQDVLHFLLNQFKNQVPTIPLWIQTVVAKYFKNDFSIELHVLGIVLLTQDLVQAEVLTRELILSCFEKSSRKGTREKLHSLGEVLETNSHKDILEIYRNFIRLSVHGVQNKKDLKNIVEMVICFEEFKLQTLLLNLLHSLGLHKIAKDYSLLMRTNKDYDFVYFDKYFSELKSYFVAKEIIPEGKPVTPSPDLNLSDNFSSDIFSSAMEFDALAEEQKLLHLVKYQNYSMNQLFDLAVSFLQSEMPNVSLRAAERAMRESTNDHDYLKGSYLKLTSLMLLKDYRAALDTCLEALTKATSKDDILSFMYGEAELYIRLKEYRQAKSILKKIISIDSDYRLAKERLEKLDEI